MREAFRNAVQAAIDESIKIGYRPERMIGMVNEGDPVQVAKRLVVSGDIQQGFREMINRGRPDLTMECIMLRSEFAGLFTADELDAARWRLQQAGVHGQCNI